MMGIVWVRRQLAKEIRTVKAERCKLYRYRLSPNEQGRWYAWIGINERDEGRWQALRYVSKMMRREP